MKFYEFLIFWARNSRLKILEFLGAFCVYRLEILEFPKRHPLTPRKSRIPRQNLEFLSKNSRIPRQKSLGILD